MVYMKNTQSGDEKTEHKLFNISEPFFRTVQSI